MVVEDALLWTQVGLLCTTLVVAVVAAAMAGGPESYASVAVLCAAFCTPFFATGATRGLSRVQVMTAYAFAMALCSPIALLLATGCKGQAACIAVGVGALLFTGAAVASAAITKRDPRPLAAELPIAMLLPIPAVVAVVMYNGGDLSAAFTKAAWDALGRGALYVLLHFGGVLEKFLNLVMWRPSSKGSTVCSAERSCKGKDRYFDPDADNGPVVARLRDDRPDMRVRVALVGEKGTRLPVEAVSAVEKVFADFEAPTKLKFKVDTRATAGAADLVVAFEPLGGEGSCAGLMRVGRAPGRSDVAQITIDAKRLPTMEFGYATARKGSANLRRVLQHCVALALGAPLSLRPEDVTYANFDRTKPPIELSRGVTEALRAIYARKRARLHYTTRDGQRGSVTFTFEDADDLRAQKAVFIKERGPLTWSA